MLSLSPISSVKKPCSIPLGPLSPEDMHKFSTGLQKDNFTTFKNRSVVPRCVMNLHQLKKAHWNVSSFFKFEHLSLVFYFCKFEVYKDPINIFNSNLFLYPNSCDLETLLLGQRIILNDFLFEKVFDIMFSREIPFMIDSCCQDFEVCFEEAKQVVSNLDTTSSIVGPLTLYFMYHIMAHSIATTLIPGKVSLNSISYYDVFVLYCLVKKYKII